MTEWLALGGALVLVIANGFFVAFEYSMVKVRATQLEALAVEGRAGARSALGIRKALDTWLSASQSGITLMSLGLGWVGEPAFATLIHPVLARIFGETEAMQRIAHTVGLVLAFGVITFLHIVVGEQVPKTIAIQKPESTALALSPPMRVFYVMFFPVIWVLNHGTRAALKLFGLEQKSGEGHEALSEEELKLVFTSSAAAGALGGARAELLERALSMMEKTARQVLVPRSQMRVLDLDATLDKNLEEARTSGHTWLPVVRGSLDRVEGIANVKELYFLHSRGELKAVSQAQKPVFFVPESVTLEQLLGEFRRRNRQLAVVVDEHGGTSGLVTLADVVAELVGNVAKLGRKLEPVRALPGGRIELPGSAQLDDLEHTLEVEFDVDHQEVTTIGGYLMAKLGRVPLAGDVWTFDEYRIVVVKTEGPRVQTVRIEPKNAPVPAPSPPAVQGKA
ncbi:MAG: HlyC/CorC family transporter [Myxococcaceae bacterium]|nr:HlyC/CorC family transporter [Myxococcaceae bacterium]